MNGKNVMRSVLAFSLVVAVVCGVFLGLSVSGSLADADGGAFSVDDALSLKIVSWMFAGCLAAFLAFTFAFKKRFSKKPGFSSRSYRFSSLMGCFVSGGLAVYNFVQQVMGIRGGSAEALLQSPSRAGGVYPLNIALTVLLLGTSAYFALCAFGKGEKRTDGFAALSLFLPASLALKLVCDYLAQNSNGFGKLYSFHLLSVAFLLLFAVNESRVYLRRSAPALYVFFGVTGSMAAIIYAMPSLFMDISGASPLSAADAACCVADLVAVLYVYVRLFSLGVKAKDDPDADLDVPVIIGQNDN